MKTNRDKFVNCYGLVWLFSNTIVYVITEDSAWVLICTYSFMFLMAGIVLFSKRNDKFKRWLDNEKRNR